MRVALVGGTGFAGSYIVDALLGAGHEPVLLVRPGSEHKVRDAGRCHTVAGDLDDAAAIARLLENADAAIYLVGILREEPAAGVTFEAMQFEGARRCIDSAVRLGARKFLLMSANGARADGTPYQSSKYRAEQYLENSGLDGTVFRPSVICGDPRGGMEFLTQLRDQMVRPPLPAVSFFRGYSPATGAARMSPVHVEDVALAFVRALDTDTAGFGPHVLGGSEVWTWPDTIHRIARVCGRKKWVVPVPSIMAYGAASLLDRYAWFPVTRDQLTMLMEGNTVDTPAGFEAFGMTPRRLTDDRLAYLRESA